MSLEFRCEVLKTCLLCPHRYSLSQALDYMKTVNFKFWDTPNLV